MKRYLFLSYGFEPPTPEIMEAWGNWFARIADRIVDQGGSLGAGREITEDEIREFSSDPDSPTGFVIFQAESIEEAEELAKHCPIISSNVVYEIVSQGSC